MALTIAEKSSCRRHLKYPVVGNYSISPAGAAFAQGSIGYRFFQAYGALEYRLNNMNPDEEARIVGAPYGAVALIGPQPNQGDTVSVTLSGGAIASPQTVIVTAGPPIPNTDMRLPLILAIAAGINGNPVLQTAKIYALAPYGTGPFANNAVPIPEVGIRAAAGVANQFTVATSFTGACPPTITATGTLLPPTTSLDGGNTTLYGYLPILDALEGAYWSTSDNLDTAKADVWTSRSNEAGQRRSLYENTVALLSDFIGIEVCTFSRQKPKRSGAISFV